MTGVFAVRVRDKATGAYITPGLAQMSATAPSPTTPYESGSVAPRLKRWTGHYSGPNTSLTANLGTLRSRSRDRRRNDGIADLAVEIKASHIVGTGIRPQWDTGDAGLNAELADLFEEWTDESDADGRLDFYGQQRLATVAMAEAGDCFVRMRARREDDGLSVPLQIQVLEAEYCPLEKTEVRGGGWIQNGVEFDAIGRRVAYWMYRDHPNDQIRVYTGDQLVRVPAEDVAHLGVVRRPGLVRGEPWLTRALVKLYEVDQVDDAMVMKTKISNLFAGFITPDATGKFAWQEDPDSGGVSLAPVEPGMVQVLNPGDKLDWNSPPDIGTNYQPFMTQQMQRIAASAQVLYEQLSGDYSKVNDRTWRAAMSEFKRHVEWLQHMIVVFQMCRPIVRRWVDYAVLSGAIRPPKTIRASRLQRPLWIPQAWAYINPVQDVEAKEMEVRAGFTSRKRIVNEAGYDVEKVDREIAADNARADDLGLSLSSDPRRDAKAKAVAVPDENKPPTSAP